MFIERKRWIIRRKSDGSIMCGSAKNYEFRNIHEIGDAKVCTYMSETKAYFAARASFHYDEGQVSVEPVVEIVASYVEE